MVMRSIVPHVVVASDQDIGSSGRDGSSGPEWAGRDAMRQRAGLSAAGVGDDKQRGRGWTIPLEDRRI
jgi:hypothetical protein